MRNRFSLSLGLAATVMLAAAAQAGAARAHVFADGPPLRAVTRLDCPDRQGDLVRVAQAPDGRSCDYEGRRGELVRLRIQPVDGRSPTEAMAPTRSALHALAPVYPEPVPPLDPDAQGDRADVDLPFIHVHAVGDRADVKLFGVRISSQGHNADIDVGRGNKRSVVHAGLRGAEVIAEDVGRTNASLVYVLAANRREASGYRAVGYVAKGPVTGPLVVAEFRSRHSRDDLRGDNHGDLDRLIDRNVDR